MQENGIKGKLVLKRALRTAGGVLEALMEHHEFAMAAMNQAGLYLYLGDQGFKFYLKEREERAIRARFYYLQRKRLVHIKRIGKRLTVSLTEGGRAATLAWQIAHANTRRDGRRLLVLFDVPVAAGNVRNRLRMLLKETGFTMLQRSVWMTDKDVVAPLQAWLKRERLEEWITVLLVART